MQELRECLEKERPGKGKTSIYETREFVRLLFENRQKALERLENFQKKRSLEEQEEARKRKREDNQGEEEAGNRVKPEDSTRGEMESEPGEQESESSEEESEAEGSKGNKNEEKRVISETEESGAEEASGGQEDEIDNLISKVEDIWKESRQRRLIVKGGRRAQERGKTLDQWLLE